MTLLREAYLSKHGEFALHITPARVFTAWRSGVSVTCKNLACMVLLLLLCSKKYDNVNLHYSLLPLSID